MKTIVQNKQQSVHKGTSKRKGSININGDIPDRNIHPTQNLQRAIGNIGVQQLLQSNSEDPDEYLTNRTSNYIANAQEFNPKSIHNSIENPSLQLLKNNTISHYSNPATVSTFVNKAVTTPGQPLNPETRSYMEPKFGHNFGHIKVHTDNMAEKSAKMLHARAFAYGNHVVFGAGEYNPGSKRGDRLIAHELTHVVQQNSLKKDTIQCDPLPRQRAETPDYTIRRLISELNDHLDHGRTDEARALVPQIQRRLDGEPLAMFYADDAATAFFRLGMVDEGAGALEEGRTAHFRNPSSRYYYSMRAVEILFSTGERYLQANEYEQAWQVYQHIVNWLENPVLTRDPDSYFDPPRAEVLQFYPRLVTALFNIPTRMRTAGDQDGAERYFIRIRGLIINSPSTYRYGADAARAFINVGRFEDAFATLRNAEQEFPQTNPLIAYSEGAVLLLCETGEEAVQRQQWAQARQIFSEAMRWVDEHREVFTDTSYNWGNDRNIAQQVVDRIMRGLLAIAIHYQQEAITAFENNDPNAMQHLQAARTEIGSIRQFFHGRLNRAVVIADIEQNPSDRNAGTYRDAFNPTRELRVSLYGGQTELEDRMNSIERILETMTNQTGVIEQFYITDAAVVTAFEAQHNHRPDIHSIQDRRLFWELKYNHLVNSGRNRQEALQELINSIGRYLQAFTFHTEYNIPDTFTHPLTTDFPRTITQQALMDCGIYAMRTAFELSLIRDQAQVDFHFVSIPQHVYLGIIDRNNAFGWALSNNRFRAIRGNITTAGIGTVVASEFNLIPSDVHSRQITSFTERGLRSADRRAGQGVNMPPNFRSLGASARRRARATSRDVSSRHTRLTERIEEQGRILRALLNILRREYNALNGASSQEFNNSTEERIERMYQIYVAISHETESHINEVLRIMGRRSQFISISLAFYFFNMNLIARYLVHVLGRSDLSSNSFIQDPIHERIERTFQFQYRTVRRDYEGTPPPWEIATWEDN